MGHFHTFPTEVRPQSLADRARAACSAPTLAEMQLRLSCIAVEFENDPDWSNLAYYATDIAGGETDLIPEFIGECDAWDREQDHLESYERWQERRDPLGQFSFGDFKDRLHLQGRRA